MVVFSLGGFIAYHVWLFVFRGSGTHVKKQYHDYFQVCGWRTWRCQVTRWAWVGVGRDATGN